MEERLPPHASPSRCFWISAGGNPLKWQQGITLLDVIAIFPVDGISLKLIDMLTSMRTVNGSNANKKWIISHL